MATFPPAQLLALGRAVFGAMGCTEHEAELVADHLVRSNLAGHDSHGIGVLPGYVQRFAAGLVVPNQTLRPVLDAGALLQFDGGRGFGQRMAAEAVNHAITRARQLGACVVGLRNSAHIGRVGTYAELAASPAALSLPSSTRPTMRLTRRRSAAATHGWGPIRSAPPYLAPTGPR